MDNKALDIVMRHEKLAFLGVAGEDDAVTYKRIKGLTELSKSANPIEYSRKYIDEAFERSDVTGYSPSMSYSFDQFRGDALQQEIINITDNELVGKDAIRSIVIVDLTVEGVASGAKKATMRDFSIIPDSEGGDSEAYTYSGNMKVNGDKVFGSATTSDGWKTITFTEDSITPPAGS